MASHRRYKTRRGAKKYIFFKFNLFLTIQCFWASQQGIDAIFCIRLRMARTLRILMRHLRCPPEVSPPEVFRPWGPHAAQGGAWCNIQLQSVALCCTGLHCIWHRRSTYLYEYTDKASCSWIGGLGGGTCSYAAMFSCCFHFDLVWIRLWFHFWSILISLWCRVDSTLISLWFNYDYLCECFLVYFVVFC